MARKKSKVKASRSILARAPKKAEARRPRQKRKIHKELSPRRVPPAAKSSPPVVAVVKAKKPVAARSRVRAALEMAAEAAAKLHMMGKG